MVDLPPFETLPLAADGPPGNAWGLFGEKDELGMLNLLQPEVVCEAAKEIRDGVRFSLDWPLDKPSLPTGGREQFHREIQHHDGPTYMNDDVVHFNTQSSTQWDGFRHYCKHLEYSYLALEWPSDMRFSSIPKDAAVFPRS